MGETQLIEQPKTEDFLWRRRLAGDVSGLYTLQKRWRDAGATTQLLIDTRALPA
jgi:hypothetical protein